MSFFSKTGAVVKRYFFKPCLHGFLWGFAFLLGAALLLQALIIWAMATERRIPFPDSLVNWIEKQAASQLGGLQLEVASIRATPDFRFFASDVRIHGGSIENPLFQAQTLNLGVDFSALLFGQVRIESFFLDRGALYCPALLSPTGVRERVVSEMSIAAEQDGKRLSISRGQMDALGIPVTVSGSWQYPFLPGSSSRQSSMQMTSPALILGLGLRQALAFRAQLGDLDQPLIKIRLDQETGSSPSISFVTFARRLSLPQWGYADSPSLDAALEWKKGGWHWLRPLELKADHIASPTLYGLEVNGLAMQTFPPLSGGLNIADWIPDSFTLQAESIRSSYGSTGPSRMKISHRGFPNFSALLQTRLEGMPVELSSDFNVLRRSGILSARGRDLSLLNLQALAAPLGYDIPDPLQDLKHTSWEVEIPFHNFQPQRIQAWLNTGAINVNGTNFKALRAEGSYDFLSGDIRLKSAEGEIDEGQFQADGTFQLGSRKLMVNIALQNILPPRLDPLFPGWWDEIWPDFQFHGRLPEANFRIANTLGWRHRLSFFGQARLWDSEFRGVYVPEATARVYGKPSITEIIDLEAVRPEGKTTGSITWVYWHNERPGLKFTRWNVDSSFDPDAAKTMFDPEIQEVFDDFEPSGTTQIRSSGILYSSKNSSDLKDLDRVFVDGQTMEDLLYRGYPLQFLEFSSSLVPGRVEIQIPRAGFAEGELKGQIGIEGPSGEKTLGIEMELSNARESGFRPVLAVFNNMEEAEGSTGEASSPSSDRNPLIDLELVASGPLNDIYGFTGNGALHIADPKLASVPVFGALSRIMKNTPLPLGNLSLTDLKSPFALEKNQIRFEEMEILGPITQIRANGTMQIPETSLDFRVRLIPGNPEESGLLSAVGSVLRPISYALELDLQGNLTQPAWRFRNNPINRLFPGQRDSEKPDTSAVEDSEPGDSGTEPSVESNSPTTSESPSPAPSYPPAP